MLKTKWVGPKIKPSKIKEIEVFEEYCKEYHRKHFPKEFRVFENPESTSTVAVFKNNKFIGVTLERNIMTKTSRSDMLFIGGYGLSDWQFGE